MSNGCFQQEMLTRDAVCPLSISSLVPWYLKLHDASASWLPAKHRHACCATLSVFPFYGWVTMEYTCAMMQHDQPALFKPQ